MSVLSGYEPEKVFQYFSMLSSVPHGSGNTKQISDLCVSFAREHSLDYYQDELNNVIIYKKGSAGYEASDPVILQGHIDMVCAKEEGFEKDMAKEGIDLVVNGDWISAHRTSLGGDNGVAVAIILAILDDDTLPHPPIEALFTVDEETGMFGAVGLDYSRLSGKKLINLDSEEEGIFTAGCAGGARVNCSIPCRRESLSGYRFYKAEISGLLSGHSGVDIDKGRASANQLMGRMLFHIFKETGLRLCSMQGGTLDNVIPKRCEAAVAVPKCMEERFISMTEDYKAIFSNEFAHSDPDLTLNISKAAEQSAVCADDTAAMLTAMIMLPYGVQEMSMDIKGLVQTSLNMGVLKLSENELDFSFSVRSCITSCKEALIMRLKATVEQMGGTVSVHGEYPAWQFAKVSPLRDTTLAAYKDLYNKDGKVFATHGGLECGLFINKIPGLDCISFGPDLCDVHSVRERLSISSTARLYALVCEILKRL
ncbi:MAG: aminoacyl-histidine dipeptidase [Ruminococcaceae bacterium]|nr:aminoacyl-histidine dipeptidase [Oscillospiraceae bacterium]